MARLRKALVIVGLLTGAAVVAGVLWREALVEAAARRILAANGLGEARLEVVSVGTDGIVIEDLALGPGLPAARRLRLAYAPRDVVSGRLQSLRIEGLRHAVPAGLAAAMEPLEPLMPGDGAGGGWFTLPRIEIADAVLTLPPPASGTVAIDGAFDLAGAGPGAVLDMALDMRGATGAFTIRSDALGEGGVVEIDGGGEAELAGATLPGGILPHAAPATLSGGRARFTLAGTVRIPALDAGLEGLRGESLASLTGELELAGVTTPATPATLSADIGFGLAVGDGTVRLDLSRPALVSVAGIPAETLGALGLSVPGSMPGELTAEIATPGPLTWTPRREGGAATGGVAELALDLSLSLGQTTAALQAAASLRHGADFRLSAPANVSAEVEAAGVTLARPEVSATLRSAAWSASGFVAPDGRVSLDGPLTAELADISLPSARAGAVRLEGVFRVVGDPDRWSLAAAPGLSLAAEDGAVPGRVSFSGPLALVLETFEVESRDGALEIALAGAADPFSGVFLSAGEEALAFADASGGFGLTATLGEAISGELTLADAGVALPTHAIGLAGLTGRLPIGGDAPAALRAEMRDTGRRSRFPPLDVALEGRRSGDALAFSGEAEALGGTVRLPLDGSADLGAMTARVAVGPARLDFRRGGLQPDALSALLPALGAVEGAVRVSADLALAADGEVRSGAALDFEGLSVRSGELAVTGLSGRLRLARLAPLATAGTQALTARSLTAGVPLDGLRARFSAEARGDGLLLRIPEASGALAGGTVLVEDASWRTGAPSNALDVRVRDLELSRLLADWHIEGISGTGRLSGVIPVRLSPAGVAIAGGSLDAAGPGVIQVDWGAARETLVNSGEQVALTVRALEDFHYETLSIGVEQPAGGELSLAISLEGANPEVLDGHPFRFNVNLGGELGPILEAVREGERIGAELLRGGLGGQ